MFLKDQVIVVMGGSRGIGRSISIECAKQGAKVAIAARSQEELSELRKEIEDLGLPTPLTMACDVTSDSSVSSLFQVVRSQLGETYGLVCAAGILGPIGPIESGSMSDWEKTIQVNLLGSVRGIRAVVGDMKKNRSGRIVLFSGGGQNAQASRSAYVSSKGAIWRLTETLGEELFEDQIYVNAIAPGAVNTRFLEDLLSAGPEKVGAKAYEEALRQKSSGGTPPSKATELALYLLSAESKGLSGKVLSALWDPYHEFKELEKISKSDLFTFKRVVDANGGTRAK